MKKNYILVWNTGSGDLSKVFSSREELSKWISKCYLKREWIKTVVVTSLDNTYNPYELTRFELDNLSTIYPSVFKVTVATPQSHQYLVDSGYTLTPA